MTTILVLALPFALIFMALSSELNWQGFIVGYIVSILVLRLGQAANLNLKPRRMFSQIWYLLVYSVRLAIDIFISSVNVARIVLSPNIKEAIDPGIIGVSTQDKTNNEIVTAMSSHGITITPGQLVVDIESKDDETIMLVHNLNMRQSAHIQQDQSRRLRLLRRILGYE